MGRGRKFDVVGEAIKNGLAGLKNSYCLDMSPAHLAKYLDYKAVEGFAHKIFGSEKFAKLSSKEQAEVLYKGIVTYITEQRPFDERGKKLFDKNLEGIVGSKSLLGGLFSSKARTAKRKEGALNRYLSTKETAGDLAAQVLESPGHYEDMPGLVEASQGFAKGKAMSGLAEVLYASGHLAEKVYNNIKKMTYGFAQNIIDTVGQGLDAYTRTPKPAYLFAIFGLFILAFDYKNLTGAVIGVSVGESFLFVLGVCCIVVSFFSFIAWKNHKHKI